MGLFTTENLEFTSQGNLLTTGPNTYMIPTMADIPAEFYVHLLPGVQNPKGLYSSKVYILKLRINFIFIFMITGNFPEINFCVFNGVLKELHPGWRILNKLVSSFKFVVHNPS